MGPAIVLMILICALVALAHFLQKRSKNRGSLARKILHIGAISVCAFAVYIVEDSALILSIVGVAVPLLALAVQKGFFRDPNSGRKSWGILYFAAVYFFLLLLFAESRPDLVYYPMLLLAWADGLATVVGEAIGKRKYQFSADGRSVEGSAAFFLSAFLVLLSGHILCPKEIEAPFLSIWMAVFVAVFLTLTESISSRGRDNLWVPLALVYWMLIGDTIQMGPVWALGAAAIPVFAAVYAFRAGWLQEGGAVAALLMAWIMLLAPNPIWIIPALVFFVVGSALSKLPGSGVKASFGNRSLVQVFSNGGFPVIALMLYFVTGLDAFLFGFAAGFACAMSDTASSEIGTRLRFATFHILNGRAVKPGLSGGVSWPGLVVGILFSLLIGIVFASLFERYDPFTVLFIGGVGFLGNVLDSVYGAALQVKYRGQSTVEWVDEKPKTASYETIGCNRVSNDVVNMLATGSAVALGIAGYFLR